MDGSEEQTVRNSKFQKLLKGHKIPSRVCEPERPKNNPAEICIKEVRKQRYRCMFGTNYPDKLWEYSYNHVLEIMFGTASNAGKLNGKKPLQFLTGETVDIYEYLEFDFYDRVWFKQYAGVGETKLGRWIGVAFGYRSLINYWVLPESGIPVPRKTLQRSTEAEHGLEVNRD